MRIYGPGSAAPYVLWFDSGDRAVDRVQINILPGELDFLRFQPSQVNGEFTTYDPVEKFGDRVIRLMVRWLSSRAQVIERASFGTVYMSPRISQGDAAVMVEPMFAHIQMWSGGRELDRDTILTRADPIYTNSGRVGRPRVALQLP